MRVITGCAGDCRQFRVRRQWNWAKLIRRLCSTVSQMKWYKEWIREEIGKSFKRGILQKWQKHSDLCEKLNFSAAYCCENRRSAQILPFDPIQHISFIYVTILAMRPTSTPYPPLRQLFPNPWMPGWRLAQPPLSELWLFGCSSVISNPGQQRFPRGETEWEICTTTHLCRAEIGWKQMAAHWMLPSACGHPPEKITSQGGFFFLL